MSIISKILAASALAASFAVYSPAMAVTVPAITGTLSFASPGGTNFFDGTLFNRFNIPLTYGNATGPTVVVGTGTEFGYIASPFSSPPTQTDTANFTDTSLTIQDVIGTQAGTSNFFMTFTSNVPGFFKDIKLTSNTFGGSFGVTGDTLTFSAPTTNQTGVTQVATFTFDGPAAVPEPATWATMILGFGMVGVAARRRRASLKAA